jgi:hypothetical protein
VNDNWHGCGRKRSRSNLRFYCSIFLEGLSKTRKELSRDCRSPSRHLNPGFPEYEAVVIINCSTTTFSFCMLVGRLLRNRFEIVGNTPLRIWEVRGSILNPKTDYSDGGLIITNCPRPSASFSIHHS